MSDPQPTPRQRDRADFDAFIEQLSQCSDAARAVVVNSLRDRSIPTFLAAEISDVQRNLHEQLSHARRILSVWPEE